VLPPARCGLRSSSEWPAQRDVRHGPLCRSGRAADIAPLLLPLSQLLRSGRGETDPVPESGAATAPNRKSLKWNRRRRRPHHRGQQPLRRPGGPNRSSRQRAAEALLRLSAKDKEHHFASRKCRREIARRYAPIARAPSSPRTGICKQNPLTRNGDVDQQPQRHPGGSSRSVGVGARWNPRAPRARGFPRVWSTRCLPGAPGP
jgi:hypothetical protein